MQYESVHVLRLRGEEGEYTGGAHPNDGVSYANFRPSTGEGIRLQDILKPGFENPLNSLAELRFRAVENLDATASLKEAGYVFPQNQFKLNDNFFIDPKGLTFVYDPGEVGCVACGSPRIFLPYADLRNLLRPDARIP